MRKKRIVHVVPVTPRQAGMYETTREIVYYERKMGYDAYIYDPRPTEEELKLNSEIPQNNSAKCPGCGVSFTLGERVLTNQPAVPAWTEDRGVCTVPFEFAKDADLIVSHSGLNEQLRALNKKYIHVAHGRPYSSFLIEHSGQSAIYTSYEHVGRQENFIAAITLWPEYKDYLSLLFPKIYAFDAFVDLNEWKPRHSNYTFGNRKAEINIVCADVWRLDKDPYHVLNAFRLFYEKYPNSKVHIYAARSDPGWNCMIGKMQSLGMVGEVRPLVPNLCDVYNAADMVITPHKIATRTVREALASGIQIVAGLGNRFTPYTADVEDLRAFANQMEKAYLDSVKNKEETIKSNRKIAEDKFNPEVNMKQFCNLYESLLK